MPFDLQVIHPRSQIPLSSLRVVAGLAPRTLEILGGPFLDVEEVNINGVPSPSVIIPSEKQILAQVPPSVGTISKVDVVSASFFLAPRATYTFKLGAQAKMISGLPKLVQTFVRLLLQTPGTSVLLGDAGGGLLDMVRSSQALGDLKAMVSGAHLCVQKAAGDLVAYQTRDARLPRNERLAYVKLLGCSPQGTRLSMEIALGNQAGESGRSLFGLLG